MLVEFVHEDSNHVIVPKLVGTINYTDIVAINTYYNVYYGSVLNRGAKKRVLMVVNKTNQSISGCSFYPDDSVVHSEMAPENITVSLDKTPSGNKSVNPSDIYSGLASAVDSFYFGIEFATLPTSGTVEVWVTEVI